MIDPYYIYKVEEFLLSVYFRVALHPVSLCCFVTMSLDSKQMSLPSTVASLAFLTAICNLIFLFVFEAHVTLGFSMQISSIL